MPHHPPAIPPIGRRFARIAQATARLSRRQAWLAVAILLPALALIDDATGRMSIGPLYLLLVCFAAWCLKGREALGATALIVCTMTAIAHAAGVAPPIGLGGEAWNLAARFLSNAMVVLLVGGLRSALELERWRADTDNLTGALNKGAFEARMGQVTAAARRDRCAVVLAYMDLDGFKQVNDRHGHAAGDRVLASFAQAAGASIRKGDLFGRIGGDEFVALLVAPSCRRGDALAEILHHRLSRLLADTGFAVTCSMGALVMDGARLDEPDQLIALADRLMYEVKRTGKNALRIARGDMMGDALRAAFPPQPAGDFDQLLARIDRADDAHQAGHFRQAA